LLGYSRSELAGKSDYDFFSKAQADFFGKRDREALEHKTQVDVLEEQILTKNHGTRILRTRKVPIFDGAGKPQYVMGISEDITEVKQAESILRQAHLELQNRFETAVRASGQLLYEWDLEANTVSYGNVETLGYALDEIGANLADRLEMVHTDDREAFNQEIERVRRSKSPFQLEYRVRKKDGSYVEVEDRGYFTSTESLTASRMVGFVADISERKKLEEQFRQAQKMEAVGQLAGGIAHDFNNLLGVIIGFCDLLAGRIQGNEKALKQLSQIRKAGDSAATLTRQLLAFSRKQVLEPRVLDLNSIISEHGRMLERLIGEDITLVTLNEADLGQVKADPGQIEQVILNLVVNARDAMPKGGKLTIETTNVFLDEGYARTHVGVTPGHYVMLAVSDTGIGMDANTRIRIFEPFFTTKKLGTGLGLATVYGIVKQSDGNIWVYSEPGKGTTFKAFFPRVDADVDTASDGALGEEAPRPGSETILLVEDSESLRSVAREFLEHAGYKVLEALNEADAVRIAADGRTEIDLLLTDVVMPAMSGREVAEQVTRHHPGAKILYVSGYTDDAIVHHGVLEDGVSLLSKPFAGVTLIRKVRQVLDSA
jgi:PAS domain S-box-containing protein